eukprot:15373206-Alexandrium_andersonii.AAC.1
MSEAQSSRQRPLRLARRPGQTLGPFTVIGARSLLLRAPVPLRALAAIEFDVLTAERLILPGLPSAHGLPTRRTRALMCRAALRQTLTRASLLFRLRRPSPKSQTCFRPPPRGVSESWSSADIFGPLISVRSSIGIRFPTMVSAVGGPLQAPFVRASGRSLE